MSSKKKSAFVIHRSVARVDLLESRRLLSAVLGSDGTLNITGTAGNDSLDLTFNTTFSNSGQSGSYTVNDNGTQSTFDAVSVTKVIVNGLDGTDEININGTETNDTAVAQAPVNLIVNDGNGNDTVYTVLEETGFTIPTGGVAPSTAVTIGNGRDFVNVRGSTQATVMAGNGDDSIYIAQDADAMVATVTAGNGNDEIDAGPGESGSGAVTVNATVGTGQDTFSNENAGTNVAINVTTSDGQTLGAYNGLGFIAGHVTTGSASNLKPVTGALVFLDLNNNGIVDGSDPIATTDANGNYQLIIPANPTGSTQTFDGTLRVLDAGFTAPTIATQAATGVGLSSRDFSLTQVGTAGQPLLFGTSGSYQNDGNTIANVVDGNVNTYFDAPTGSGAYVGLDYGSPQLFSSISYAPRAGWAGRMVGGTFQASNSQSFSNAVTLYKITTTPTVGSLTTVPVTTAGAFEFVRYVGPASSFCNIAEMNLAVVPQAGSVVVQKNGTLVVTGTPQADNISVNFTLEFNQGVDNGVFTIVVNNSVTDVNAGAVKQLVINGTNGNDSINVTGGEDFEDFPLTTSDKAVNVVINEGSGNNNIYASVDSDQSAESETDDTAPSATVTAGDGNNSIFTGDFNYATVTVGNGNNTVDGSAGYEAQSVTVHAGNGQDSINGESAGDSFLTMTAYLGTGPDTLNNGNDPDIGVVGYTSDGQQAAASNQQDQISGRVTTSTGAPLANAIVYIDPDNSAYNSSDLSAVTNSNGDYTLTITGNSGDYGTVNYQLRVIYPGYTASPGAINQGLNNSGLAVLNDDFVLTSTMPTPTLFGTTGSYQNDGNTIAKAVDGNLNTYFDAPTSSGAYVALDYGSPQVFAQIQYAPRSGWASRMVGGTFQASNSANFSNAVNLYTITTTPAVGQLTTVNLSATGTYRYVRYIGPSGGFCNIAEMKFAVAPQDNSVTLASDGTLTITGTEQADTIKVNFLDDVQPNGSSGTFTVVLNGTTSTWDASQVTGIAVNGFDGDDNIDVEGTEQNDTQGIPLIIHTTINEGDGNDTINTSLQDYGISSLFSSGGHGLGVNVTAGDGNNYISVFASGVAIVKVGNGNNDLNAGSDTNGIDATFYAGNGNNTIAGAGGSVGEYVEAHVGTGQNTFQNGQDPDVQVHGVTSDGQEVLATDNQVSLAGRVYSGSASSPVAIAGATVFIDSNNNGILDSGEPTATTGSNGDYLFNLSNTNLDTPTLYTIRVADAGSTTAPISYQQTTEGGAGYSGLDFLVTPMATQPVLFGTSGSYQNDGNTIANVVDGNLNTYFDAPTSSGGYVALDYGSPQVFAQIQYAPRPGWASRMVGGIFQGSNSANFSSATTLYTITTTPTVGVLTLANVTGAGAFRYVRYIGPSGSFCNIAEMDFNLAGKLKGTVIGTAGSYKNQGNTIANAFDGNPSTFFDGPDATGDWVGLDVGTATLKAVEFEARAGFESRMVGGEIQASNSANFSTGVVTLATITTQPQAGVMTTLGISNIYSYRYYRYIGPANSYCNIAELEFIG